jgi:hypothetical protein
MVEEGSVHQDLRSTCIQRGVINRRVVIMEKHGPAKIKTDDSIHKVSNQKR